MLASTFLHIKGISIKKELDLWWQGVRSWDALELILHPQASLFNSLSDEVTKYSVLLQSRLALQEQNADFFSEKLPRREHYRIALALYHELCTKHGINDVKVFFPPNKRNRRAEHYFNASSDGRPAISSIPGEIGIANKNAMQAAEDSRLAKEAFEYIETKIRTYGWLGGATLVLALVAVLIATWSLIQDANKNVTNVTLELSKNKDEQADLKKQISVLSKNKGEQAALKKQVLNLETEIKVLFTTINQIEKKNHHKRSQVMKTFN